MLAIDLPDDIASRLDELARRTGRSQDEHVREAVLDYLEDLEDLLISEERVAAIRRGDEKTIPLEEIMKQYGLAD